ncbi:MAG: 50S ribosomal protein L4 [Deltaproteobacteria bacterium]|nr:50S ribosomal protein L4 [Deltaproteobacteria bacterium]
MQLPVYDANGKKVSELEWPESLVAAESKPALFSEVVRMQLTLRRSGTVSTKTRAEVSGGNKKPYKQKGTGRARQGSSRSPQFVGGGRACGPKPKTHHFDLNKKMKNEVLKSAISMKLKEGKLSVVEEFSLEPLKTKTLAATCKGFNFTRGLIVDVNNEGVKRAARNLSQFKYLDVRGLNLFDLLKFENLLITRSALSQLMERFRA